MHFLYVFFDCLPLHILLSFPVCSIPSSPVWCLQLVQGIIHYIHNNQSVAMHTVRVDDGDWHYVEVRWYTNTLVLTLDYGQIKVSTYN